MARPAVQRDVAWRGVSLIELCEVGAEASLGLLVGTTIPDD